MLRVRGPDFDVDAFVDSSPWDIANIYIRGESALPRSSERIHTESGFTVVVSDADFHSFAEQIDDAVSFLSEHREEFLRLAAVPGIDVTLDFGIALRDTFTLSDRFPAKLVSLAGKYGLALELSHYPIHP